ncbi:MAG: LysR family transcriptional regulator [Anaerolineae bacterium]|nr:LysR family transcriptional regulator [Anaerolineae bacterium]
MELRQLRTFQTIATLHSFNQAAKVLDYAQSTVSEQIKALETDLNVRLFKRAGKQVALTEAGEILLQYAQKILNLEEEVRTEVGNHEETYGSLSIRIPETVSIYYLPPILKKFQQRFPKVGLNCNNCTYFSLQEELRSGVTNLAFLIVDTFRMADLVTEELMTVPLAIVTSPDNPLASRQSIGVHDLKNETVLVPTADCSYVRLLEKILTEEKVVLPMRLQFNCIEAIKKCVIAGAGITMLPQIAVKEELTAGSLVELPWVNGPIYANLLMIWQKDKWMSPILRAFMEIAREVLVSA